MSIHRTFRERCDSGQSAQINRATSGGDDDEGPHDRTQGERNPGHLVLLVVHRRTDRHCVGL